jgi:hypothetical protein
VIDTNALLEGKWLEGGRDWPNVDCYGVLLHVRALLGLDEWPRFDGVTKKADGLHHQGKEFLEGAQLSDSPAEGDTACCYEGSTMRHVGIVINTCGGLRVVECNPGRSVTLSRVRSFEKRFNKVEFYR